jgi:excisionase family DNA binding protein
MRTAAPYLGLSLHALKQRVFRRTVPFVRMGHSIRFDLRELDEWLGAQRVGTVDEMRE